jgi:RNA-splicing ligase RtcB
MTTEHMETGSISLQGKYTTADVMIDDIDDNIISQIYTFINNFSFTNPVKIMPDCHVGKGAVIGFTMPMGNNVIPNIVGVDLSCGMLMARLDPKVIDRIDFVTLDETIRANIPMGGDVHSKPQLDMEKDFPWWPVQKGAAIFTAEFNKRYHSDHRCPKIDYDWFLSLCERISIRKKKKDFAQYIINSIGTLGGGNHFIEIGIDEEGCCCVTTHSGSRNLGLRIATYWQDVAIKDLEEATTMLRAAAFEQIKVSYPKNRWQEKFQYVKNNAPSVPKGLEPLYGHHMYEYLIDTLFAHQYAHMNRVLMMNVILDELEIEKEEISDRISTIHNYIDYKDFIIRKGAISSYEGEKMIIPFNMEDGILVCEGKSNPEWNFSAPHGAGRLYSRTVAKAKLNVEDARFSMTSKGIYASVLPVDELKGAYKPAEVIEEAIEPTARILHRVKPIMNIKAGDPEEE